MKQEKCLPIPQKQFGFPPDTFNLFTEIISDGDRLSRENEQPERDRPCAEQAHKVLLDIER
jgi:hypothetical protein